MKRLVETILFIVGLVVVFGGVATDAPSQLLWFGMAMVGLPWAVGSLAPAGPAAPTKKRKRIPGPNARQQQWARKTIRRLDPERGEYLDLVMPIPPTPKQQRRQEEDAWRKTSVPK